MKDWKDVIIILIFVIPSAFYIARNFTEVPTTGTWLSLLLLEFGVQLLYNKIKS